MFSCTFSSYVLSLGLGVPLCTFKQKYHGSILILVLHPAINWLLVWLQRAISLLEKPLWSGKSNSWRNMGIHSMHSRHVPNPPPSPCKMLISPQPTGATYFSFLHIGNLQLRSSFALHKVKRPPWRGSILTNGNILNLTSLVLPCATGCKCIEISSHFLCSRFQALCNSHNPHYANVVFCLYAFCTNSFGCVFLVMCNFTHPVKFQPL